LWESLGFQVERNPGHSSLKYTFLDKCLQRAQPRRYVEEMIAPRFIEYLTDPVAEVFPRDM